MLYRDFVKLSEEIKHIDGSLPSFDFHLQHCSTGKFRCTCSRLIFKGVNLHPHGLDLLDHALNLLKRRST